MDFGTLLEGLAGLCPVLHEATCAAIVAVPLVLSACALADMVDEHRFALAKRAAHRRGRDRRASAGGNLRVG